jgi:chemosensory pili system protein ChpC
MSTHASAEIRGVLIQVEGARLLLPNATIAEVLSFAEPEPLDGVPRWLLGRIRWRGWQLPLVSFSRLSGIADETGGLGSKVVVLKALGDNATLPHVALLTQGFPRLVTVARDALVEDTGDGDSGQALPTAVRMRVLLNNEPALLPDVDALEGAIRDALAA